MRMCVRGHDITAFHPSLILLQVLYESCDRLRPSLFRLASDTVDDDAALAQILTANDDLTLVITAYKEQAGGGEAHRRNGRSNSEEEVKSRLTNVLMFYSLLSYQKQVAAPVPVSFQLLQGTERLRATISSTCRRSTHLRRTKQLIPRRPSMPSPLLWKARFTQQLSRTLQK